MAQEQITPEALSWTVFALTAAGAVAFIGAMFILVW